MADGEHDAARDDVEQRLAAAGLRGAAFDVDAITADYLERLDLDSSLDDLIGPGDTHEREDR